MALLTPLPYGTSNSMVKNSLPLIQLIQMVFNENILGLNTMV